jgi:hypothetical protein
LGATGEKSRILAKQVYAALLFRSSIDNRKSSIKNYALGLRKTRGNMGRHRFRVLSITVKQAGTALS